MQKTIRCAKDNKMCKKDVQKTTRCAKNNKMYKKRKTVYWDLINSNVNKRDVQMGCSGYSRFQGFFICHIIVIQGIIRSEM